MKTYDEIVENVVEATAVHRRRVKKIQRIASTSAMCAVCVLGLSVFLRLEPQQTLPDVPPAETQTSEATASAEPEAFTESTMPSAAASMPAESHIPETSLASETVQSTVSVTEPTEPTASAVQTLPAETVLSTDAPAETSAQTVQTQATPASSTAVCSTAASTEQTEDIPVTMTEATTAATEPTDVPEESFSTESFPAESIPQTTMPTLPDLQQTSSSAVTTHTSTAHSTTLPGTYPESGESDLLFPETTAATEAVNDETVITTECNSAEDMVETTAPLTPETTTEETTTSTEETTTASTAASSESTTTALSTVYARREWLAWAMPEKP